MIAILAGLLLAFSASPYNWWPLAIIGLFVLYRAGGRSRFVEGRTVFVAFFLLFLFGLSWTRQYSLVGYILLSAVQALFFAFAVLLLPRSSGWQRALAFPALLTVAELARTRVPWGGLPMGGITTGQASGMLSPAVALVGEAGMVFLLAAAAVSLDSIRHRTWSVAVAAMVPVLALPIAGVSVSMPVVDNWKVATVQGGGVQALRRGEQNPAKVYRDHLRTSEDVGGPVDMLVWPENVIITNGPIADTDIAEAMRDLAQSQGAAVVAGVVEDEGSRFRNAAVSWDEEGITGRYEKVQRVPFGEYVPNRQFVSKFADLSQVPSDAIVGTTPPVIRVRGHLVGVGISYEGLFSRRLREAVRSGGEVLVIPTNASSFESSKVAATQIQAARLRARETGRWVLQSSPTGRSAIVDPKGRVHAVSTIGPPAVLQADITLHSGFTPYVRWGDAPMLGLSAIALMAVGASLWLPGRNVRTSARSEEI